MISEHVSNSCLLLARWVSVEDLRFKIVNSTLLAKKWGQVKHSQAMGWNKIKKVKQKKVLSIYHN